MMVRPAKKKIRKKQNGAWYFIKMEIGLVVKQKKEKVDFLKIKNSI